MNDNIRKAILAELKAGRDIADAAEAAGRRDLTSAEYAKVEAHLKTARDLKLRAESGADLQKQLGDLADGIGLNAPDDNAGYGGGRGYTPAGSKSNDGACKWGEAVVAANSDGFRYKGVTPAGSVIVAVPEPAFVPQGQPVPTMRTLIPSVPTLGRFSFYRQTVRENRAAPVAAGTRKPTSDYSFELVEDRARVLAHLSQPQSRMDFSDAPALSDFISSEMFYGLERCLEDELLNGDGTGEHLTGLAHTDGVQPVGYATDLVTTTRKAVTALEVLGYSGTGWVLSPQDWENIELSANDTGSLLLTEAGQRAPVESAARRLWGRPVVASPACPVGVGYFADFSSTKLYVREDARLDWSEHVYREDQFGEGVGGSLFEANELLFRAEGRFGFAVLRPSAIAKIDLAA
jgi:HK97 family phage major capsid protein